MTAFRTPNTGIAGRIDIGAHICLAQNHECQTIARTGMAKIAIQNKLLIDDKSVN